MRAASRSARAARAVAVGAACGLAWSAAFRAYMAELVATSTVTAMGTFVGVLLPGVVCGALLGWSWLRGDLERTRHSCWFAFAPMAFAVAPMLAPGALLAFITRGLGGGAIAVALAAIAGGYGLGGRRMWLRITCGVPALFVVAALAVLPAVLRDAGWASVRALWAAVLGASLLVVLMISAAIPFRNAEHRVGTAVEPVEYTRTGMRPGTSPATTIE